MTKNVKKIVWFHLVESFMASEISFRESSQSHDSYLSMEFMRFCNFYGFKYCPQNFARFRKAFNLYEETVDNINNSTN